MDSFDQFFRGRCFDPSLDSRSLTGFQRMLLCSDGTVTDALQAYYLEPMKVLMVSQQSVHHNEARKELDAAIEAKILERIIILAGNVSGRPYLFADSLINLSVISDGMAKEIIAGGTPIGTILSRNRLETRRQITHCGRLADAPPQRMLSAGVRAGSLYRTYKIFHQGHPIMRISEYFPEEGRPIGT